MARILINQKPKNQKKTMRLKERKDIKEEVTLSIYLKARDWFATESNGLTNIYLDSKGNEIGRTIFSAGGNPPCKHFTVEK